MFFSYAIKLLTTTTSTERLPPIKDQQATVPIVFLQNSYIKISTEQPPPLNGQRPLFGRPVGPFNLHEGPTFPHGIKKMRKSRVVSRSPPLTCNFVKNVTLLQVSFMNVVGAACNITKNNSLLVLLAFCDGP